MIEANDPSLKSWINVKADSDFPIQNLPFGVFKEGNNLPRVGSIVGEKVIDLHALMELGYLDNLNLPQGIFEQSELNPFIALGKSITNTVRNKLSEIFCDDNPLLRDNPKDQEHILHQEGHLRTFLYLPERTLSAQCMVPKVFYGLQTPHRRRLFSRSHKDEAFLHLHRLGEGWRL